MRFRPSAAGNTFFAPPERAEEGDVRALARLCMENPIARVVLESVDGFALILNAERQILAANQELLDALGAEDPSSLLGFRPGEALQCIHSHEAPEGCGTSKACSQCGAVLAMLACQAEQLPATGECLLSMRRDGVCEAVEYQVRATPLRIGQARLLVFVLHDISAAKRRDVLEHLFLHDLQNLIQGLSVWSEILCRTEDRSAAVARKIMHLSRRLGRDVDNQRLLLAAEQGRLQPEFRTVPVREILEELRATFEGRALEILAPGAEDSITTDPSLLERVLVNMVTNALEATSPGGTVRLGFEREAGRPRFFVWNGGCIPPEVGLRIFQRSFSTKRERGHGLGTYGMKLFGERYLGGTVAFTSTPEDDTCFSILLP